MTNRPGLNVVVVAYGSPDLLRRCLDVLGDGLPVLVIDNSSNEKVRGIVEERGFRYFDAGSNTGFAAGANRALAELGSAHGDVLLLNPDAQVTEDVARALQVALRTAGNERVACTAPALTGDDGGAEQVEWAFPSPGRSWLEALGAGAVRRPRGFLIGAVLLLRSEAIDEVGGFDERFFLYAEETDWQQRAIRAGWSVRWCPDLVAGHTGAGTSADDRTRQAIFHASVERYVRKWYGPAGWQTFRAGVLVGAATRCVLTRQRAPHRDRSQR
jgi:GT2 family glycosyltransferase